VTHWWRQTRVRLTLAYSGTFSLVALVAAAALWGALATVEYGAVDDGLVTQARALEAALNASSGLTIPGNGSAATTAGADARLGVGAFLFDGQARLLDGTRPLGDRGAMVLAVQPAFNSGSPVLKTQAIEGRNQRLRASRLIRPDGETRVLVVTRSLAETDQVVFTTAVVLLLGTAMLVVAASVLGYGLAGTALRPVREIAAAARTFSEEDLHRRIVLDLPSDELGQLADTFNTMLERLETAFESLRRFTADAAHELRAPLALIRTEAEVTLGRTRSPSQYQASLGTILQETTRLGRLADQLLLLARADAGALAAQMGPVDLPALVDEAVTLWKPLAGERGAIVEIIGNPVGGVRGDRDLLRRLLDNLLDNAVRHSPPGGHVGLSCEFSGHDLEIRVTDAGEGVSAGARASIFDRFTRGDDSRGRHTGGAGLGLALCAAIAQLHDGTITVDDAEGGGARFIVRLPAATS